MGFTIFQNRGNVGMSRMTEVMGNILLACMGSDAKGMPPSSQHDHLGDRSIWMYLTPMPSSSGILERIWISSDAKSIPPTSQHDDLGERVKLDVPIPAPSFNGVSVRRTSLGALLPLKKNSSKEPKLLKDFAV
ncbi:hypothetical protein AbraIFM66951_012046 [Aspergillus brasiliensis]|uniref:Uncharacterized protein n=1 Tax=Aspergillus brasiliensis TaxID=319629 RepID=A0A9W5Z0I0_9EURO|nr:hypothetical protein AbraCBS73388_003284 [Aspergillus brasiliensis]GKZ48283.1 hypothetical protein AbraIFM66951_012046 [Aspergillus brasiliensis]